MIRKNYTTEMKLCLFNDNNNHIQDDSRYISIYLSLINSFHSKIITQANCLIAVKRVNELTSYNLSLI